MKKTYFTYVFSFFIFSISLLSANTVTGAIKDQVSFTWTDGVERNYYPGQEGKEYGGYSAWGSGADKSPVYIDTVTFYDEKLKALRTIQANENFIVPDEYSFSTDFSTLSYRYRKVKKLYISNGGSREYYDDVTARNYDWKTAASDAVNNKNLNYYIGGNSEGSPLSSANCQKYPTTPEPHTIRHTLIYKNGIKVGQGGDGYVFVTERGGNNSQYVVAYDMQGDKLGDFYLRETPTENCSYDENNDDVDYVATGAAQDNGQEICVGIYPIQELAPAGSTIGSIELWSVDTTNNWGEHGDPADGKIFLVHTLEEPDLCYDYTIRQDSQLVPSDERRFSTVGSGDLAISVAIKSMESDYVMSQSQLTLDVPGSLSFEKSEYSPDHVNILIDAVELNATTHTIGLGQNVSIENHGGTIDRNERYFSKFTYRSGGSINDAIFNIDMNITVDTSESQNNPIIYNLTTDPAKYEAEDSIYRPITRCPQSATYNTEWVQFNTERIDSGDYDSQADANHRYPLYTQVVGRDFDFSVLAYDANSTPAYTNESPTPYDITVDVELIDASSYDDNTSFFRCNNTDPDIIQHINQGERSIFVPIKSGTFRTDVKNEDDLITDTALRSAAFRMWVIVDNNNTIVPNNCTDKEDNACFQKLYDEYIAPSIETGDTAETYCSDCSAYAGGCYQCLRDYFANPTCSRDNFSIRPASYSIALYDTNESIEGADFDNKAFITLNNDEATRPAIAAGYKYYFEGNATRYNSDENVLGYTRNFYSGSKPDVLSELRFDDSATCLDQNNTDFELRFFDGQISGAIEDSTINLNDKNLQKNANVGEYIYHIEDTNWTLVDQKRYEYKTFPDVNDCYQDESIETEDPNRDEGSRLYSISDDKNGISGCGISSNLQYNAQTYYDMKLRYEPYSFDLSDVNLTLPNNQYFVYTNNMDDNNSENFSMATNFRGFIVAKSKDGETTTNYTSTCAASNVRFDIDRNMTSGTRVIDENNISAENENFSTTSIYFQSNYVDSQEDPHFHENNDSNASIAIEIDKSEFSDDLNGSAPINVYYNFSKVYGYAMNPIKVNFITKEANATQTPLYANLKTNYYPYSIKPIGTSIDYYSGRVVKDRENYVGVPGTDTVTVELYVEAYCDDTQADMNCSLHELFAESKRINDAPWYINTRHNTPEEDGNTSLALNTPPHGDGALLSIVDKEGEAVDDDKLTFDPDPSDAAYALTGIALNQEDNKTDINVSVVNRPASETIIFVSDVWLDPTSADGTISFPIGGGWSGSGNTGNVVESNASFLRNNGRVDW